MNELTIAFVLGTRPEILKLASVIQAAKDQGHYCTVVHTGQHYDHNMSSIFFSDLSLPEPDIFIGVGSGTQGYQAGKGLIEVEAFLIKNRPDIVAVVGDTNAGVSGALAACKLGVPVAHFEAGARSYDWTMPEEMNRRILDSISRFCFAPTELCLSRLQREGRGDDSWFVGDTLVETALRVRGQSTEFSDLGSSLSLRQNKYGLLTIHRAENTDDLDRLTSILKGVNAVDYDVVFPAHPRTRKAIADNNIEEYISNLIVVEPLPYSDFLSLIDNSTFVITDSGGVQQEACIFGKPSLTVRNNTEWMETIHTGGNRLVRADHHEIRREIDSILSGAAGPFKNPFQLGASMKALNILREAKANGELEYPKSNFFEKSYEIYSGKALQAVE